jgi:hypothetical protein
MTNNPMRSWLLMLFMAGSFATSSCAGGGCSGLTPLPGGRYTGPKTDNAVNARLSGEGVAYLNANWRGLIDVFAPGQRLNIPVPCTVQDMPVVGDVTFADQNGEPGRDAAPDAKCTADDKPANVAVTFTGLSLRTIAPGTVEASLTARIETDVILFSSTNNLCVLDRAACSVQFLTSANAPADNTLSASIQFTIDTKWDKLLSFSIASLGGVAVCGSEGAPAKPACLDPDDLKLDGRNSCGNGICGVANFGPIKGFVLRNILGPRIQDMIQQQLQNIPCQACGAGQPVCPSIPGATSTCNSARGVCLDTATNKCVPRPLGIEGQLQPAVLLSKFGIPTGASLDLSMLAGSTVVVDRGLTVGTRAGVQAKQTANCVPLVAPPTVAAVAAPNFDGESGGKPYHVALGLSQTFFNNTFHHAHQSGTLCLQLDAQTTPLLNTGAFFLAVPSIEDLAVRDGKNAPMMIAFRPRKPPTISLGDATAQSPLLTLDFKELDLDIYALLDDRYVRLFGIRVDLQLPLTIVPKGCSEVEFVLGDLSKLLTNLDTSRAPSELLPESLDDLKAGLDAILGPAQNALASALPAMKLPQFADYQLRLSLAKSLGKTSAGYGHLGLYTQLVAKGATCLSAAPMITASLSRIEDVSRETLGKPGTHRWPVLHVAVNATGIDSAAQYGYRVDGGLWTDFQPAAGGYLQVTHPALLLDGHHTVEIRARPEAHPGSISESVEFPVLLDRVAPKVTLRPDRAARRLLVDAVDGVSEAQMLQFAYQVGTESWSSFGPARVIDLVAVDAAGGASVRVRDEAGNVQEASYRPTMTAVLPDHEEEANEGRGAASGCAATGNALPLFSGILSLGLLWRRRRGSRFFSSSR